MSYMHRAWCWNDSAAIYHYGIKGQKWGVRRGPPYPIEDKVLRKGTKLSSIRVAGEDVDALDRIYTFNPEDEYDAAVYRGPYAMYKYEVSGQNIVEQIFTVKKDLRMPTSQERFETFKNLYSSNPKSYAEDLKKMQSSWRENEIGTSEARNVDLEHPETDADYRAIFEIVNKAMDHLNSYEIAKKYSDIMRKSYDAMVDDADQGNYNYAHDPIIIFEVNKCLQKYGDAKLLDYKDMDKNFGEVWREMAKRGEDVSI